MSTIPTFPAQEEDGEERYMLLAAPYKKEGGELNFALAASMADGTQRSVRVRS